MTQLARSAWMLQRICFCHVIWFLSILILIERAAYLWPVLSQAFNFIFWKLFWFILVHATERVRIRHFTAVQVSLGVALSAYDQDLILIADMARVFLIVSWNVSLAETLWEVMIWMLLLVCGRLVLLWDLLLCLYIFRVWFQIGIL